MFGQIWFWQRIVSPHMAGLVAALTERGLDVVYVAEAPMSKTRAAQGWRVPEIGSAQLLRATNRAEVQRIVASAPANSIHICQGLRGNGLVGVAQRALRSRGLRQWAVMETVQEHRWLVTLLKQLQYRHLINVWRNHLEGILAIGHTTPAWLMERHMPESKIIPFAYFLPDIVPPEVEERSGAMPLRILFVGRLIELKRIDLVIDAVSRLADNSVELAVVGAGPMEQHLRALGKRRLGDRVTWLGRRDMREIPTLMSKADCLVLPSRHDGWGAVVSEALMVGTPVICSHRCGAAAVVRASGFGGVFPSGDVEALSRVLNETVRLGRLDADERRQLAAWGRCLGARAGAAYLLDVLGAAGSGQRSPPPPWVY